MEIQKACPINKVVTSSVCLRHNWTFHCGFTAVLSCLVLRVTWYNLQVQLLALARKYINEHRVVHDYDLCAMVKTAQDGDLKAHV